MRFSETLYTGSQRCCYPLQAGHLLIERPGFFTPKLERSTRLSACASIHSSAMKGSDMLEDTVLEDTVAALVWFRNCDLRLADHLPLSEAASRSNWLVPFFCLSTADLSCRTNAGVNLGTPQLGPHKLRFLLESVADLGSELKDRGTELLTLLAEPEELVTELVHAIPESCACIELYHHLQPDSQSESLEAVVAAALRHAAHNRGLQSRVNKFWGATLYHPECLPHKVFRWQQTSQEDGKASLQSLHEACQSMPGIMTDFRKAVDEHTQVKAPLCAPASLPPLPPGLQHMSSPLPSTPQGLYQALGALEGLHRLAQLCSTDLDAEDPDPRSAMPCRGGAHEALQRLHSFLGVQHSADRQPAPIGDFKAQRMMAGGLDNSAKLSASMAAGCLSPRQVHQAIVPLMADDGSVGEGAGCMKMHLQIRDFFIFTAVKAGNTMLRQSGLANKDKPWRWDADLFAKWAQGRTGFPFVDACMRELAATGYMSNRGRQNCASFLTKGLKLDWRYGAQLFESLLIDHDFAVNYVNWNYFAGIGNDPRDRMFQTVRQGLKYDPEARLIKAWIPELADLPTEQAHMPWTLPEQQLDLLRQSYPPPVIDPDSQQ